MEDIFKGMLASLELIEEFYVLDFKEIRKIKQIKKGLKELIKIEEDVNNTSTVGHDTFLFID